MAGFEEAITPRRKQNWSAEETMQLVQLYKVHAPLLTASFNVPGCTKNKKIVAWEDIATQLKEAFPTSPSRNLKDCQKRWQYIQMSAKKNIARHNAGIRATGGGSPTSPPLSDLDELVADILGHDNVVFTGFNEKPELLSAVAEQSSKDGAVATGEHVGECSIEVMVDEPPPAVPAPAVETLLSQVE